MAIATYIYSTTLTVISCGVCGIPFAMPENLHNKCVGDGSWFYCPNGHNIHYSETENQRLTKQLEQKKSDVRWYADQLSAANENVAHERRRAASARGHLTRIKNRIVNGVCPVPGCKRSGLGADVVAHIATCHPEYHAHEELTPVVE